MLKVATKIAPSRIHGVGLFTEQPIQAGTLVWLFEPPDYRIPLQESDNAAKHFGYINPANPRWLVRCGDQAAWWNFASTPNCGEASAPTVDQEAPLIALRDIAAGEELTLGVETDADSARKLRASAPGDRTVFENL